MKQVARKRQLPAISFLVTMLVLILFTSACTSTPAPASKAPAPTPAAVPSTAPAPSSAPAVAGKVVRYSVGSSNATSSAYAMVVLMAALANKAAPEQATTVVESGATHDNLIKMGQGTFDWAGSTAWSPVIDAYLGQVRQEYIKAGPNPNLRFLFMHGIIPIAFTVRVDAKINSIKDLDGKSFSAGIVGSNAEEVTKAVLDAMGVKPKYFIGSFEDAVQATKENRAIGFAKTMTGTGLAADQLDVLTTTPIKIIGWTDEELAVVGSKVFGYTTKVWEANSIKQLSPHPAIKLLATANGQVASAKIPQDIGYKMWKGIIDNWDQIVKGTASAKDVADLRIANDVLLQWSKVTKVPPFHAGMVQLLQEKGITVPTVLIPPEYKPVK